MSNYQDKKVVIIGLGMTGLSCVNFFIGQGVMPKVMDTRVKPHGLDRLPQEVERYLGGLNQRWLLESDLIICSPGVALSTPELQKAADAGIDIIGDIELFCREVKAPVIAITGSNGKSTVTTLLGEMAKQAGITVGIGGNIGLPALTLLTQPCQLYILELSSFQLETTDSLKAAAATVLNVTEDHMDRYPNGLEQYQRAKLRIYSNAESCIINHDDVLTYCPENSPHRCVSFGLKQGNYHLTNKEGETWLTVNNALILNCSEMGLSGQHNYTNALAAMALADSVDIPRISQLDTLRAFNGLAHRFQLVLQKDGVRWINDSKATNVGSTEAALNGLTVEGTLHLLLGGDGKSADFSPLSHYLQGNNIRTYCFGRDAEQLKALRPDIAAHTETLEQAMKMIASKVKPGDMVLLSPACASLDQFSSYEHRGDEFTRLAKELG